MCVVLAAYSMITILSSMRQSEMAWNHFSAANVRDSPPPRSNSNRNNNINGNGNDNDNDNFNDNINNKPRRQQKQTQNKDDTNYTTSYISYNVILEQWNSRASVLATDLSKTLTSPPSYLPSPQHPFVFFHMRKGGGSSIRSILWNSIQKQNQKRSIGWIGWIQKQPQTPRLDAWIPCHGRTPCVPFSLPPASTNNRKALYAGHVNYAHMAQLVRELDRVHSSIPTTKSFRRAYDVDDDSDYSDVPDVVDVIVYQGVENDRANLFGGCITNIRPTVSRVESCWNYRMVQDIGGHPTRTSPRKVPTSSSMTPEEWSVLLPEAVDRYGNGCNNEIARILGDTQHEQAVNQLSPETSGTHHYGVELDTILGRMAECVIVRVDRCADSNTILRHFLPWMEGDLCTTHENVGNKTDTANANENEYEHKHEKRSLSEEAKEAILSQNHFDELVFSFGTKLFEAQLAVATTHTEVEVV